MASALRRQWNAACPPVEPFPQVLHSLAKSDLRRVRCEGMRSARLVGPLVLVMLAACAGVDSPSASCGNNPSVCPPNLLVDDAAESGLFRGPVKAPPTTATPTAPTPPTTPTPGPSLPTWTGPAAAAAAASKLKDSPQTSAVPEVEAAKKQKVPDWKQRCIDAYYDCQQHNWTGNCHDCLRLCEGQQEWPEEKCHAPSKRRRR